MQDLHLASVGPNETLDFFHLMTFTCSHSNNALQFFRPSSINKDLITSLSIPHTHRLRQGLPSSSDAETPKNTEDRSATSYTMSLHARCSTAEDRKILREFADCYLEKINGERMYDLAKINEISQECRTGLDSQALDDYDSCIFDLNQQGDPAD